MGVGGPPPPVNLLPSWGFGPEWAVNRWLLTRRSTYASRVKSVTTGDIILRVLVYTSAPRVYAIRGTVSYMRDMIRSLR